MIVFHHLALDYSGLPAHELLGLCAIGCNTRGWDEFLRRFHTVIMTTVWRTAQRYTPATRDLCEQLARQVYLDLRADDARLLRESQPAHDGAAFDYVKLVTARLVHQHFQRQGCARLGDPPTAAGTEDSDRWRKVDDVLRRRVSDRERQIFWLCQRYGMTAAGIAAIPAVGLKITSVESILARLRELLDAEFSAEQRKVAGRVVSDDSTEVL